MNDLDLLLTSGGDERLDLDPVTGLNKYLCSPLPDEELVCFSSCTASRISAEGYTAAAAALERMTFGRNIDAGGVDAEAERIAARLDAALDLAGQARILLTPSGTDAALLATILVAAECPDRPVTSIMVAPGETGSGVPSAASGRFFSDRNPAGRLACWDSRLASVAGDISTIHVGIRDRQGRARDPGAVASEFAAAARSAPGRPIIHLMAASKTGLHAPVSLPPTEDVIVDACQARLSPARIRSFLARGWPVLLTGSKFYGGPPFSGAVLMPAGRCNPTAWEPATSALRIYFGSAGVRQPAANVGTVLRWAAAMAEIERFHLFAESDRIAELERLGDCVRLRLRHIPGIDLIDDDGLAVDFSDTIFSFSVRNSADSSRRLSAPELRPLYRELASFGVLIGQPVEIAPTIGALRVAIGARTLFEVDIEERLDRLFTALIDVASPALLVAAE